MLFDGYGRRKYLTISEWRAFLLAADSRDPLTRTFCYVLAHTGARISEVRALTAASIDLAGDFITFECLKRRQRGVFRPVPVPHSLILLLEDTHGLSAIQADRLLRQCRLWPWCRTTAWSRVKAVCKAAGVPENVGTARAFRHTYGVEGVAMKGVPLGTMKRWLGHVRLESTTIYTEVVGAEERALSGRMWRDSDLR
ncbi:MAG: site-specific integrase [Alphaproteobacteria bacterium]|nr:site-specific integrase [Alphaproteobacteria bacterium]